MSRDPRDQDLEREIDAFFLGKKALDARGIARLVHAVNPTERGLGKKDAARRYALKAQLQSEFVRRFADDLVVRRERDGQTLSIAHGPLGFDVGHVPEVELEDDARSIVRRLVDAGGVEDAGQSQALDASTGGRATGRGVARRTSADGGATAIEAAERAREEWDFEEARRLLDAEVGRTGAGDAVRALLALLVDDLADDAAAVRLGGTHRRVLGETADARERMASAHARLDDAAGAEVWLREIEPRLAPDAFGLLGAAYVRANDLGGVERVVGLLRRDSPAHPATLELARTLAERLRERARAVEAELEERATGDDDAAVREVAMRMLALDPTNAKARAAIARLDEAAARAKSEARRKRIADALDHGERELARGWLGALRVEGERAVELEERLRTLDAVAHEGARQAEVVAIAEALDVAAGAGTLQTGLVRYASADAQTRAEARSRAASSSAAHLDAVDALAALSVRATPTERVAAAETLVAIAAAGERIEASAALARLATHGELLGRTTIGRDLRAKLERRRIEEGSRRAAIAIERATTLLVTADVVAAAVLLAEIDASELDAATLDAFERVREDLADAERDARAVADHARAIEAGWFVDAANLADAAARASNKAELQAKWSKRAEDDRVRARVSLRSVASVADGPPAELHAVSLRLRGGESETWLDASGRFLYVLDARSRRITVREVDTTRDVVTRRVSVHVDGLAGEVDLFVTGPTLTIAGERNGDAFLASIDRLPLDAPLQVRDLRRVSTASGKRLPCGRAMSLDEEHVLISGDRFEEMRLRVVNLQSAKEVGRLPESAEAHVCHGLSAPLLVVPYDTPQTVHAHRLDGVRVATTRPLHDAEIVSCVVDDAGEKTYLARRSDDADGSVTVGRAPSGAPIAWSASIDDSGGDSANGMVIDVASESLLVVSAWEGRSSLYAQPLDLRLPWVRSENESEYLFATDVRRRVARVIARRDEMLLCREVADFLGKGAADEPRPVRFPLIRHDSWCSCIRTGDDVPHRERTPYESLGVDAIIELVHSGAAPLDSVGHGLFFLGRMLSVRAPAAVEFADRLFARHPDDARVQLAKIEVDVFLERWSEARAAIAEREPTLFDGLRPRHATHLAALVAIVLELEVRDVSPRAAAILDQAVDAERDECALTDIRALVGGMLHGVPELTAAMDASDQALARGDVVEARDTLHRPLVFDVSERQCLARLAHAWLAIAPADATGRLMAWDAMALFVQGEVGEGYLRSGTLPRPIARRWSEARVAETLQRSIAWMEAFEASDSSRTGYGT